MISLGRVSIRLLSQLRLLLTTTSEPILKDSTLDRNHKVLILKLKSATSGKTREKLHILSRLTTKTPVPAPTTMKRKKTILKTR